MRIILSTLVVVSSGLGATSFYLYQQVQVERARAHAATVRADQLKAAHDHLQREVADLSAMPMLDVKLPAKELVANAATSPQANENENDANPEFMRAQRQAVVDYFNSPVGQKLMVARMKRGIQTMNGEIIKEMQLSAEQADGFINLLAEQQRKIMDIFRQNPNDPAAANEARERSKAETDAALTALLGTDKYQQYQDYQKTMPERMQADNLTEELDELNIPLNSDQRKQLLAAVVDERERVPSPKYPTDLLAHTQLSQVQQDWQDGYNQRLHDRAAEILTAEQLGQYDELQRLQSSIVPMGGRMLGGVGFVATPGAIVVEPSGSR